MPFSLLSPYTQWTIVASLLLVIAVYHRLAGLPLLEHELNVFFAGLLVGLIMSWNVAEYWVFLVDWLVSFILAYLFWLLLLWLSEKMEKPYHGEGGLAMLIPLYIFPLTVWVSLPVKGGTYLIRWFFV